MLLLHHAAFTDGRETEDHCSRVWKTTVIGEWTAIREERSWEEKSTGRPHAASEL